jgi:hypothetical protein
MKKLILFSKSIFKKKFIRSFNKNLKYYNKSDSQNINNEAKGNKKEPGKIKKLIIEYGKFGLIYWTLLWFISGIGIYFLIEYKFINLEKAKMLLEKYQYEIELDEKKKIITAIALNEILEIIRFPFMLFTLRFAKKIFKK